MSESKQFLNIIRIFDPDQQTELIEIMKQYNFDEIIDRRHTNALNTDGFRGYIFHAGPEKVFPYKDEEFIRMWVADMEFAVAPEILQAITDRVDRRILGYTLVYDKGYYAVSYTHLTLPTIRLV